MSDILYMKRRSFNLFRAMLFGYKPTLTQRAIYLRSDHTHAENQHSSRYGGISFSCTQADGVDGCRFKMIEYSHEEYWDTVLIPVTAEQEAKIFIKECDMANAYEGDVVFTANRISTCVYGSNHVKYDKAGAGISYLTQWKIWKPSKTKMVCNRASDEALLVAFPTLMYITYEHDLFNWQADFASFTPSQSHGMLVNYFKDKY